MHGLVRKTILLMASLSMLRDSEYEPFVSLVFYLNKFLLFQKKNKQTLSPWKLGLLQPLRYNSFRMPVV